MESEAEKKIIAMLDVLATEAAEHRAVTTRLCSEVSTGFNRIERRLDRLETRVENVEIGMRAITDLDHRVSRLDQGSPPNR